MDFKPITFDARTLDSEPESARGRYLAEVTDARYRVSAAGNPTVVLRLTLVEMLSPLDESGVGATAIDYLVFTRRALWRANLFARAAQVRVPAGIGQGALEEWAATLPHATCVVDVEEEDDYRGQRRLVVRRYVRA